MEEHTNIDSPECYKCKMEIDGHDPSYSMSDMSGAVWELKCDHCGTVQNVSPSIEWKTWELEHPELIQDGAE